MSSKLKTFQYELQLVDKSKSKVLTLAPNEGVAINSMISSRFFVDTEGSIITAASIVKVNVSLVSESDDKYVEFVNNNRTLLNGLRML
jgi:hypothetical protein